MKYFVFLAFFLIRLNCVGQDSTKNLSNHSISFTGGCNIIYPNINQYEIITNSSDFVITPEVSYNPWFDLSYNRLLHNYISSSFWLNFGIGFIENKYKAISNGYEYNDFGKYYISGVFNNEENVYALEGSLGLSVNNRIMKKIDWTNSIQMLFRYQVSSSFINFPGTNDLLPNEYYLYGYVIIMKYYLDIGKDEQKNRLKDREKNPLKQWKISPIDLVAQKHWKDYSVARDEMLLKTNFKHAPWFVVDAEDKKAAHNALISHLLKRLKYHKKDEKLLAHTNELVYPATPQNIKEKLF